MLYLTTRNKADSFTAHRVLHSTAAPDGGQFMPMQLPVLEDRQLAAFEQMSFSQIAAAMINLFFGTSLTGWDVDFSVGRQAVTVTTAGHKVFVAETWHNLAGTYTYLVQRLYALACNEKAPRQKPSLWFEAVVNMAVLFAMHAQLCRQDIYEFDIAIESADLQQLFAVRYAQKMGLPVGKIILGSLPDDGLWEFTSHGEFATGGKRISTGLESLLWLEFGRDEAANYLRAAQKKSIYHLSQPKTEQFRSGMFTSVVGQSRAESVAKNVAAVCNYSMDVQTARAFGALQDYRAKTGVNGNTLLLSLNAPAR